MTTGKLPYKRIVIKIGSNVLTRNDGRLHTERISQIVDQIAELHSRGIQIILVSSGAVAAGKGEYSFLNEPPEISAKQVWSAIGQVKLMVNYFSLFGSYNIQAGQILATKENFQGLRYYTNMENGLSTMLDNKIIPIINENDTVTVTELMFTDNDELSGLVAIMMNADALFILTVVEGVFTKHPEDEGAELIQEISTDDKSFEQYISPKKSFFGKGGMNTKCTIAQKVAVQGIDVHIASGVRNNILLDIIDDKNVPHTFFKASVVKRKEVKHWLPRTTTFPKASITIKEQAVELLRNKLAANILISGVEKVEGFFEADDLVKIYDMDGKQLGIGKVKLSADELSDPQKIKSGTFIDKDFLLLYKY